MEEELECYNINKSDYEELVGNYEKAQGKVRYLTTALAMYGRHTGLCQEKMELNTNPKCVCGFYDLFHPVK